MASVKMTVETFEKIQRIERELHDLLPVLDGMEECGIECQAYRSMIADWQNKLSKAKQHFAP